MTVIYGDNGSGKSGYSRVLKRACRARDQSELILPNANLPVDKAAIPQACFEVSVDGANQDVQWLHGLASPALLSAFSIFDTRCARAYLDNEDDFSYVPYGLDVFEGLAKLPRQQGERVGCGTGVSHDACRFESACHAVFSFGPAPSTVKIN